MPKKIRFLNCRIDFSKKIFRPRIETEFWVKQAIEEIRKETKNKKQDMIILDIFAGSGCIGIAILKNIENSRADFVDIEKEAIAEIKINLVSNKIPEDRYKIYKSNLFEKLKRKKYDFVFANPPYVALNRLKEVQKEVLEREPRSALFAGKNGMYWLAKFLREVKSHLEKDGIFYLEFDPLQKEKIKEILEKEGLKFSFRKDQFGKFRWLKGMRKKNRDGYIF